VEDHEDLDEGIHQAAVRIGLGHEWHFHLK
jgi:hypothetical protein